MTFLQRRELFEGERIDRSHDPKLTVEFRDPRRRRFPVDQLRFGCIKCGLWVDAVLTLHRLDKRFEPHRGFAVLDLDSVGAVAKLVELLIASGATTTRLFEQHADCTHLFALAATMLLQLCEFAVEHPAAAIDQRHEVVDDCELALDPLAPLCGVGPSSYVGVEPFFDLGKSRRQEREALLEPGATNLELAALSGDRSGEFVES